MQCAKTSLWMLLLAVIAMAATAADAAAAAQPKTPQLEELEKMERHEKSEKYGEQHDPSYDHEMFLGKEGAREFTGLRADEAKTRLGELFDERIDANKDGKASKEELAKWMHQLSDEHVTSDVDRHWRQIRKSEDEKPLTWAEYAASKVPAALPNVDDKHVAAVLKALQASDAAAIAKAGALTLAAPPKDAGSDAVSLQDSLVGDLVRESRRWVGADGDKDGKLSKAELRQFLYPDDFPHMREVLVQEAIGFVDKDGDGKVSMAEFLRDMWSPTKDSDEKEPDWVEDERKSFREVKDKNKDGFLDRKEFADYYFSHDQEKATMFEREATHLISEADADKDGALSRQEIVGNLQLFAGSAATNYGNHIGLREDL